MKEREYKHEGTIGEKHKYLPQRKEADARRTGANPRGFFSSHIQMGKCPDNAGHIFENYKQFTNENGLHVLNVFVHKPFIAPPPEKEPNAYKWYSGELLSHYHNWLIKDSSEVVFDCHSSGIPHKHAMTKLIAQKMDSLD
jgi:hypothetical protein